VSDASTHLREGKPVLAGDGARVDACDRRENDGHGVAVDVALEGQQHKAGDHDELHDEFLAVPLPKPRLFFCHKITIMTGGLFTYKRYHHLSDHFLGGAGFSIPKRGAKPI